MSEMNDSDLPSPRDLIVDLKKARRTKEEKIKSTRLILESISK